jgi:hypothetical protein
VCWLVTGFNLLAAHPDRHPQLATSSQGIDHQARAGATHVLLGINPLAARASRNAAGVVAPARAAAAPLTFNAQPARFRLAAHTHIKVKVGGGVG